MMKDEPDAEDENSTTRPALNRSASANWAGLRRASKRAVAMKDQYDKVQTEKRLRSPLPTHHR